MSRTDDIKRRNVASKRGSKRPTTRADGATSAGRSDDPQLAEKLYKIDIANNPVPDSLRKHGITGIRTNKAPGQTLVLPPNAIINAFGKILYERLMAKKQAELDEQEKS